jgi:hypothetical protein
VVEFHAIQEAKVNWMKIVEHRAVESKLAIILGVALLVCAGLRAQDKDFSKVEIKVTKVSGNIYMLEGDGGNIAASVGEDGIVIVDDQFAPLADKIQAALKNLKNYGQAGAIRHQHSLSWRSHRRKRALR